MDESIIRYRMDALHKSARVARREALVNIPLRLLMIGLLYYSTSSAPSVGLGVLLWALLAMQIASLIHDVYRAVSYRRRIPDWEVAMVFDAEGATFHPLGRPRVRMGWAEFSMEVRWHESITVRHGRTKRRFFATHLDITTPRIIALANRASAGAVTVIKK